MLHSDFLKGQPVAVISNHIDIMDLEVQKTLKKKYLQESNLQIHLPKLYIFYKLVIETVFLNIV